MAFQGADLCPGLHIPQNDRAIPRPRSDGAAVGRKGHGGDPGRMPLQGGDRFSSRHVPQLDREITPSPGRSQEHAVGRERHGRDLTRMPFQGADDFPGSRVPQLDLCHPWTRRPEWLPPEENDTEATPSACPSRVAISPPDFPSHNLIVRSQDPEARVAPSGEEKETELTASVCPLSVANDFSAFTCHSLISLSHDPEEASVFPSGEKATELTSCPWASRVATRCGEISESTKSVRPASPSELMACTRIGWAIGSDRLEKKEEGISPSYSNSTSVIALTRQPAARLDFGSSRSDAYIPRDSEQDHLVKPLRVRDPELDGDAGCVGRIGRG